MGTSKGVESGNKGETNMGSKERFKFLSGSCFGLPLCVWIFLIYKVCSNYTFNQQFILSVHYNKLKSYVVNPTRGKEHL